MYARVPAVGTRRDSHSLARNRSREVHAAAAVGELDEELGAVGVQAVCQLLVAGQELYRLLEGVFHGDAVVELVVRLVRAGVYKADASPGARLKVVDDAVVNEVVLVRPTDVVHAAHHYLVLDLAAANLKRLEELGVFESHIQLPFFICLLSLASICVIILTYPVQKRHFQSRL